jgi:nucleotidyltransferase substrate binding protein (TIGR01987 family)
MAGLDVRWRQRLQNYSRALSLLRSALENGPDALNDLEKEGAVQRFEYTVELAWKCLKDYLEFSGVQLVSVTPKSVIKAAFAAQFVSDGQLWIDMLDHRNVLSHKYDQSLLGPGLAEIQRRYLPALEALQQYLQGHSAVTLTSHWRRVSRASWRNYPYPILSTFEPTVRCGIRPCVNISIGWGDAFSLATRTCHEAPKNEAPNNRC